MQGTTASLPAIYTRQQYIVKPNCDYTDEEMYLDKSCLNSRFLLSTTGLSFLFLILRKTPISIKLECAKY